MPTYITDRQITFFPLDEYTSATAQAIIKADDEAKGWQRLAYELVFALLLHTGDQRDGGRGSAESVATALQGCIRSLIADMSASSRSEVAKQGSELMAMSHFERTARLTVVQSYVADHVRWAEDGHRRIVVEQALEFARSVVPGAGEGADFWRDHAERAIAGMYAFAAHGNPFHDRRTLATVTQHLLMIATSDTWSLLAKSDCELATAVGNEMLMRSAEKRAALQTIACHYLTQPPLIADEN